MDKLHKPRGKNIEQQNRTEKNRQASDLLKQSDVFLRESYSTELPPDNR